jgi:hypothetical protein
MRNPVCPDRVMVVNRPQSIDIRCEIDSLEESFRGQLRNERGITRSFRGWTEFATALMALARDTGNENSQSEEEK